MKNISHLIIFPVWRKAIFACILSLMFLSGACKKDTYSGQTMHTANPGSSKQAAKTSTTVSIKSSLLPAKKSGGLIIDSLFVWCSSVIKVDATYHMFASAWPAQYGIDGWLNHSRVIRATSTNLLGPYTLAETVLSKRPGQWDSERIHNPKIVKVGDKYVLYYISTANETGYAVATSITGPWNRNSQKSMPFSNPAPLVRADNSIYVFGRLNVDGRTRGQAYTASTYNGTYNIVRGGANLLPNDYTLEDPTIWWANNQYNVICTDFNAEATGVGKAGVQYYSKDGLYYQLVSSEPVNTKTIRFDDGSSTTFARVERPFVYTENGVAKAYFLGCKTMDNKGVIIVHPVNNYVPTDEIEPPYYRIKVVNNPNYFLHSASATPTNGTNVDVYGNGTYATQQWQLIDTENGYKRIASRINTNLVVESATTPANGVNVRLGTWGGNTNTRQQWLFTDIGGGAYKISVRADATKVIDCSATPANGVNVQMWNYVANNRQQWILERIN
jgi:hypothetical protein